LLIRAIWWFHSKTVGRLLVGIVGPPKNLVSLAVLALQIARVDWRLPYPLGQCLLARAVPHGEHTSLVANWLVRGLGASTFAAYPAFRAAPMVSAGEVLSARRRLKIGRICQTILVWLRNENPTGNLMGIVSRIAITRIKRQY
jgi:hypothetical protein